MKDDMMVNAQATRSPGFTYFHAIKIVTGLKLSLAFVHSTSSRQGQVMILWLGCYIEGSKFNEQRRSKRGLDLIHAMIP
jgi:hypothetical protein